MHLIGSRVNAGNRLSILEETGMLKTVPPLGISYFISAI
jgi:hypothetical protein